jgi:hypothetical protein
LHTYRILYINFWSLLYYIFPRALIFICCYSYCQLIWWIMLINLIIQNFHVNKILHIYIYIIVFLLSNSSIEWYFIFTIQKNLALWNKRLIKRKNSKKRNNKYWKYGWIVCKLKRITRIWKIWKWDTNKKLYYWYGWLIGLEIIHC